MMVYFLSNRSGGVRRADFFAAFARQLQANLKI